jgi:hypothetical protein
MPNFFGQRSLIVSYARSAQYRFVSRLTTEVASVALIAFVLPLLPALIWWIYTGSAIHFRGWINVEYLLLLYVMLLFPCRWMIALLAGELAISLIEPIAHLYYFSPADAVFSLKYLSLISNFRLAGYVCLFVLYVVVCVISLRIMVADRRSPMAGSMFWVILIFIVLGVAIDLTSGRRIGGRQFGAVGDPDLSHQYAVRVPVLSLLNGMLSGMSNPGGSTIEPLPSALKRTMSEFGMTNKPNIVLVLTESWGLAQDFRVNDLMFQPYRTPEISERYRVETGVVPFLGHTTSGETRELCGDSRGHSLHDLPTSYFAGCWPSRLAEDGYDTLAVHGFTPTMFNRAEWYREMGFQESDFLPQLERDGANICNGAFPGVCDADVAHWIGNRLLSAHDGRPMFVHWVTLNSHLPLPSTESIAPDCVRINIEEKPSLCTWFSRVQIVQNNVAKLAMTAGLPPTIFVVVGDHAPPFVQASLRDRFSQTTVPYVLLFPRAISGDKRVITSNGPHDQGSPISRFSEARFNRLR